MGRATSGAGPQLSFLANNQICPTHVHTRGSQVALSDRGNASANTLNTYHRAGRQTDHRDVNGMAEHR